MKFHDNRFAGHVTPEFLESLVFSALSLSATKLIRLPPDADRFD